MTTRTPSLPWETMSTAAVYRDGKSVGNTPAAIFRDASRKSEPVQMAPRRPFQAPKPRPGVPLKTAQIFQFTGSNTPYQSHE